MEPKVRTFLAPKRGEALEDCEDSIYPMPGGTDRVVFAVSDGTTTSFLSGPWARILTRHFCENPSAAFDDWREWLACAQKEWHSEIQRRADDTAASFYTKNDIQSRKPAAATFVGLILDKQRTGGGMPWRALVLGDSCIFVLRKDGLRSMELTRSDEFSNIVKTAESYASETVYEPKKWASGPGGSETELYDGDSILLATDALSKWLLKREEQGLPVWGTVLSLGAREEFVKLVEDARREEDAALENDDVSLAVITIGTPHEQYLKSQFDPKPGPEKPPHANSFDKILQEAKQRQPEPSVSQQDKMTSAKSLRSLRESPLDSAHSLPSTKSELDSKGNCLWVEKGTRKNHWDNAIRELHELQNRLPRRSFSIQTLDKVIKGIEKLLIDIDRLEDEKVEARKEIERLKIASKMDQNDKLKAWGIKTEAEIEALNIIPVGARPPSASTATSLEGSPELDGDQARSVSEGTAVRRKSSTES